MRRIHHLRALPPEPPSQSLTFVLMAATKHAENGHFQAMLTALADALWVQHEGRHERIPDFEMLRLIRDVVGLEWDPPTPEQAA